MERKVIIALAGVAVAFGLLLELAKRISPEHTRPSTFTESYQDLVDDQITDLDQAQAGRIAGVAPSRPLAQMKRVGNMGTQALGPGATSTNTSQKSADGKGKKKDDKKKKAKKKKKTKKKKAAANGKKNKSTDAKESEDQADTQKKDTSHDDNSGMVGGTGGTIAAPVAPAAANDITRDLHDWEILLLPQPNFKLTEKFIQYYNSGLVSPDIFYAITREMLEDPRPQMRQLGVIALGSGAPSARSFAELALIVHNEQGVTPVKTQAQGYMKNYTQLSYLRHLGGAMLMKDEPFVNMEAMRMLRIAVDIHLKPLQDSRFPDSIDDFNAAHVSASTHLSLADSRDMYSTRGPQAQAAAAPTQRGRTGGDRPALLGDDLIKKQASVTTYFKPFVIALTQLQESYPDTERQTAASETLKSLKAMMPETTLVDAGQK